MLSYYRASITAGLLLAAATGRQALAAPTRVAVGNGIVDTGRLRPGTTRYLRYEIHGDRRVARDIWQRTVAFEVHDGKRLLHLTQRWDEVSPPSGGGSALEQDSWFDAGTFAPITQVRRVTKADGVVVSGFRFTAAGAVGMQELAGNTRREFSLPYAELPFNFEYDMELLQTLPLREGMDADIPFYDAGIDRKAERYHFKVVGSASIVDWGGREQACWIVTADYNTGSEKSRFWFDKRSGVLVREEATLPAGGTLIKTLLPPEAVGAST